MRTITTVQDLRDIATELGSHFFTPDAMRFFNSRVSSKIRTTGPQSGYFITSERDTFSDTANPRLYSVRRYAVIETDDGGHRLDILTTDDMRNFPTMREAEKAMREL